MAVIRVREGERPSAVIAWLRFSPVRDLPLAEGRARAWPGTQGAGLESGYGTPAQAHPGAGAPDFSLDQRQEPAAVRIRFLAVDAPDRA